MNAFEFIRDLWVDAQLAAPPFMQRAIIPRLHEAKELVRLLSKPYLPVYQIQGQGQGGPLTVTYVGLDYTKPFLIDLLFVDKPVEQKVGQLPFWHSKKLGDLFPSDMIMVEAAKHLIRKLPCENAIVFPEHVDHVLDVRGNWQGVCNRFHKTIRKNELRWIRKYGYEYQTSHAQEDFEEFYHQMYLPTVHTRYGELASPVSIREAYQCFRYGWLFKVTRGGSWVSGAICEPQQHTLNYRTVGVRNADPELIRQGATTSTYYATIHWANQHGYEAVNFGGTAARLSSTLFQHKRKWGTRIGVSPSLHRLIWIHIWHNTLAVSRFLKENPFVVVDENDRLHGLIVVDDPHHVSTETKTEWENHYVTPGLSSLVIRSVSRFTRESPNAKDPDLVIPIPFASNQATVSDD